ncbi:hypothetical protein OsI_05047 [Oryza sativa Indica Group]|uniref:Potassium transporter n=1 Tax=Oryza sativa subsp. indica TaxID=39946 RepID=A2WYP0_ORYSI|nr:hypothetical protein OsI_05047 [Oryza sativa Indica Group]
MTEPLHTSSNGGAERGPNAAFESEKTLQTTTRLQRFDSLHMEAGKIPGGQSHTAKVGWATTLHLAFQSIGVVYGDMGTSPLYVFSSTFTNGIKDTNDILGVMSLIIYTVVLLPLIKYCFIVLRANDNGDGGTFALYSLISRYARISLIPNQQAEDAMVSHYKLESPSNRVKRAHWIKEKMENSPNFKIILFLVTILATSMVIGDGVLTPCISVLSAVGGIKESAKSLTQGQIAGIAIAILIVLFLVQRFGTDKVGYSFGPIILTWFIFIAGTGVYNLFKHDTGVLKAFNPKYIVDYFERNGKQGWISLGGVILCITGTEAMFADLGHFNVRAIQIGFSVVLLPSVLLAYIGQAAYLRIYPEHVADTFYKSIPAVTAIFQTTDKIGNAYGIAVVFVMFITTLLVTLVMVMIWKTSLLWIALFPVIFGGAELIYLSSAFYKFTQYLPISKIETKERFLFRYVEPKEYRVFRCVVRYGYNDKVEESSRNWRSLVMENLKQFIHEESLYSQSSHSLEGESIKEIGGVTDPTSEVQDAMSSRNNSDQHTTEPRNGCMDEIQSIHKEMGNGVVHLLGETNVVAEPNADFLKKIIVDYVYNFIRKNFRQPEKITCVPHNRLLRVGMTYEI